MTEKGIYALLTIMHEEEIDLPKNAFIDFSDDADHIPMECFENDSFHDMVDLFN